MSLSLFPVNVFSSQLSMATGPVKIKLTNDYLFRAMLQTNNRVLKGLIAALLHLNVDDIASVEILNPIVLGDHIDQKTYILDVLVCLNNETIINLEMQVVNQHNWQDRSLSYLCREFDHLNRGEGYAEAKPVIQIGILDFTPFPEHPEFYAHYSLLNEKYYYKYNDKFRIHVLDLTQISLATQEDKDANLDYWANLFKAETWEDLKNMAQKNDFISDAVSTIYTLSQDAKIQRECAAREEYYAKERQFAEVLSEKIQLASENEKLSSEKVQLASENEKLSSEKVQLASENEKLSSEKVQLSSENERLRELLRQHNISDQDLQMK